MSRRSPIVDIVVPRTSPSQAVYSLEMNVAADSRSASPGLESMHEEAKRAQVTLSGPPL
jgi:hypothetical protein